ncbi:hypothetical protein DSO57_1026152 [Entomophthora muscae]|uniref:Uncharacterized protein n=1 Tax=Entomophthora muscae TaxID=34485 RepID=A0ACC2UB79_9FUNG|nr:hypothetical protein DSO57_1026152 [Entomophthora muscae]
MKIKPVTGLAEYKYPLPEFILETGTCVMNDISPKISGKLQLGELNLGPDSDGCEDPSDPWAVCLCFLWLANEKAGTSCDSNLVNQGNFQICQATDLQSMEECHRTVINLGQSRFLEALNKHAVTPILADGSSGEGFTAQLDNLKLEVQAVRPRDLWVSDDLEVTPRDVQTMGPGLTQLGVSEGHLVQNAGNISDNDEVMRILLLDCHMEVIPAE